MAMDGPKVKRGFACLSRAERSKIGVLGGRASGGNFKNNPDRAREAGRKGGLLSGGKFVEADPQGRAAALGRKGGRARTRPMGAQLEPV